MFESKIPPYERDSGQLYWIDYFDNKFLVSDWRKNSVCVFCSQLLSAVQSSLFTPLWLARVAAITKKVADMIIATINTLKNDCFFIKSLMFDEVRRNMLREF